MEAAAEEEPAAVDEAGAEVGEEPDAAVAAHAQTAEAEARTCSAVLMPQAEMTQFWASDWMAADCEAEHWHW